MGVCGWVAKVQFISWVGPRVCFEVVARRRPAPSGHRISAVKSLYWQNEICRQREFVLNVAC